MQVGLMMLTLLLRTGVNKERPVCEPWVNYQIKDNGKYKQTSDGRPPSKKICETAPFFAFIGHPVTRTNVHVQYRTKVIQGSPSFLNRTAFSPDAKEDFKVPSRSHHSKRPRFPTFSHHGQKCKSKKFDVHVGCASVIIM